MALATSLLLVPLAGPITIRADGELTADYDSDDEGLIEISNLEQLNAVRFDLDGSGGADGPSDAGAYAEAFPGAVSGMGCPDSGCAGYELTRDLDFDDPGSYASVSVEHGWSRSGGGAGWGPIGYYHESFNSTLDGNGHTVASLFIDRNGLDGVGLFSGVGVEGVGGLIGEQFHWRQDQR